MPIIHSPTGTIYNVSSNNARVSQGYSAAVRVKLNGVILAEVFPDHSNPLAYIQRRPHSIWHKSLVEQMRAVQVPEDDIKAIMFYVPSKKYAAKKAA